MKDKNICLISRSLYPHPISKHTQNMKTFEGWLRFWTNIVVVSQCQSGELCTSHYKNIHGVLLPLMKNKYFNVAYFTITGFFKIRQLHKQYDFDIYQASDAGGAILALIVSRIYGKKFVFEVQGDIFDYPSQVGGKVHSSLVKFFSEMIVKKADYIRIVSPFLYDPLDRFGINREKIFLVPPRCDSTLFSEKNVAKDKPKILCKNQYNLLFVGNLLIAKGVDILLEAFALIVRENPDIGLIFVGDGEEKPRLEARAKELDIDEKVFLLGRVEYNLIPTFMYYSDILILPSIEEGVGRVLLEAMSLNLPIVASNVGGIPLVIDNNKDGLLFEVGEIESLKEKVLFLLSDVVFSEKMTKVAHQKFLENYEYEVSMKKFINMYISILET
jgi:glycosyltransferase involved in cell wall biosynthesis